MQLSSLIWLKCLTSMEMSSVSGCQIFQVAQATIQEHCWSKGECLSLSLDSDTTVVLYIYLTIHWGLFRVQFIFGFVTNVSIQHNFIYVIRQIWDVFSQSGPVFFVAISCDTCLSGLSSVSLDRLHICLVFSFIIHISCSFCTEFPQFHGTRLPVCLVLCFMGWTAYPWPVCSWQLWQKQLTTQCDGLFRQNSWRRMGFSQWRSWNSMQRTLPPPCTTYCWNAWVRAVHHKQTLGAEMNVCKYKGQLIAMLMIIIDYLWHPIL